MPKFFVSYMFKSEGRTPGFGNVFHDLPEGEGMTQKKIEEIQEEEKQQLDKKWPNMIGVIVTNFQRLDE